MDFQQLDVLEDKIKKLLNMVKALQSEKDHLARKYEESERTIQKLKLDLDKWSTSAEENEELNDQISEMKKEREEVRGKIERLISHLEELEAKV